MGKVLSAFQNGFAGAIARSVDDVVVAMANRSGGPVGFGMPVALAPDGLGVVPFDGANHTAADFVGVTVRAPAKTPDAYGSSEAGYASGDLADVLVRGHVVVRCTAGTPAPGDAAAIVSSTGAFGAGSGEGYITLNNARFSGVKDTPGMAEIVLTQRNVV